MATADPEWGTEISHTKRKQVSLLELLGDLPVFELLTWTELSRIQRIVHRRQFVTGESVIQAWIPRSGLFVVLSGSVNVVRDLPDGGRAVLDNLGPGELLGEFAILDDSPRSTSIYAAEPSELIGFFRPDLMDLVQTDPTLGFKILLRLSQIMAARLLSVVKDLGGIRAGLRTATEALQPEIET